MAFYLHKNGQRSGPVTESDIVTALKTGRMSPTDLGIATGGSEWKPLSELFPNVVSASNAAQPFASAPSETLPKKRRRGLIFGVLGLLFGVFLLIAGGVGFLAYRNLFPADSREHLPDQVKNFKLKERYPGHGDVWGSKIWYAGMYTVPPKDDILVYMITIFNDEHLAKIEMEKELLKDCSAGDKPIRFSFDKDGTEVSQGVTCYSRFYVNKGGRVVTIGRIGNSITLDDFKEFMENLPFNEGAKMVPMKQN